MVPSGTGRQPRTLLPNKSNISSYYGPNIIIGVLTLALHGNDQFFSFGIREWGEGGRPIRLFIFFFLTLFPYGLITQGGRNSESRPGLINYIKV